MSNTTAVTSRAHVMSATPDRYAKQLISHLGRKIDWTSDGATATAVIGDGTGQVLIGDGALTLLAAGKDEQTVATIEHVLGSHLERFGARDELVVSWTRAFNSSAGTS